MSALPQNQIPEAILKDSVLAHIAAAWFAVGKGLERKTGCSTTRGFILSTLRGGAALNQNQIAELLGFDRTVVHRAIRTMVREGLLSEQNAPSGRAILIRLTPKGNRYRERLIQARAEADESIARQLTPDERTTLLGILKRIAESEF